MKIAVAMSGGVDSSVAAALLLEQGHDVIGLTMRLFTPHESSMANHAEDAAKVARHLGIPHHVLECGLDFREQIIDNFIQEYLVGCTPNPCVRCNRYIKFGLLLDAARNLGADLLATGHYARIHHDPSGEHHLLAAHCHAKDQSYFLYGIPRHSLKQILFPLGNMETKEAVRDLARQRALPVADKGDSQEVCFIPHDDYAAFLEGSCSTLPGAGDIVHVNGTVLGRHRGCFRYTIGQRKGLGIAWREPLYVIALDTDHSRVIVGENRHTFASGLISSTISWLQTPLHSSFTSTCKIRYRHQPVPCHVTLLSEQQVEVRFTDPQRAITPGQSVVFYEGDKVLGGGLIAGPLPLLTMKL